MLPAPHRLAILSKPTPRSIAEGTCVPAVGICILVGAVGFRSTLCTGEAAFHMRLEQIWVNSFLISFKSSRLQTHACINPIATRSRFRVAKPGVNACKPRTLLSVCAKSVCSTKLAPCGLLAKSLSYVTCEGAKQIGHSVQA